MKWQIVCEKRQAESAEQNISEFAFSYLFSVLMKLEYLTERTGEAVRNLKNTP